MEDIKKDEKLKIKIKAKPKLASYDKEKYETDKDYYKNNSKKTYYKSRCGMLSDKMIDENLENIKQISQFMRAYKNLKDACPVMLEYLIEHREDID